MDHPALRFVPGLLVTTGLTVTCHAFGGPAFSDTSAASGLGPYQMAAGLGGGVNAVDIDDDGDIDLFVGNEMNKADQLYLNVGGGIFADVAAAFGIQSTALRSRCSLWFDYDGDHDLDLLVAGDHWGGAPTPATTLRLYRRETSGPFTDQTVAAGLFADLMTMPNGHIGGLAAGDIDNDGYLDLIVTQWLGATYLYHNEGDGTFTDITVSSGLSATSSTAWQPTFNDVNGDGLMDIFICVDFDPNRLWINQGDLTFVDIAPAAGCDADFNEMGVYWADYDNDGDLDFYTTNISTPGTPIDPPRKHSVLYRNDSVGPNVIFEDVSYAMGVADVWWGWGVVFQDANRDGWVDLAITNGRDSGSFAMDPSKFYLNAADGTSPFIDVSDAVGFNDTNWGSSLVSFDCDRDGDLDLIQTCNTPGPLRLYESLDTGNNDAGYLTIKPRMAGTNHYAVGAIVRVSAGGLTQMRLITAGISFMGQEPFEAVFGIGSANVVNHVAITWPNGRTSIVRDVATNQVITINDDESVAVCRRDIASPLGPGIPDGNVDALDFLLMLSQWGPCPTWCEADITGPTPLVPDGSVDALDFLLMLSQWGSPGSCEP